MNCRIRYSYNSPLVICSNQGGKDISTPTRANLEITAPIDALWEETTYISQRDQKEKPQHVSKNIVIGSLSVWGC